MKTENQTKDLIKMDNTRELYHSPQLEVFEIKVEKGFAASTLGTGNNAPAWGDGGTW